MLPLPGDRRRRKIDFELPLVASGAGRDFRIQGVSEFSVQVLCKARHEFGAGSNTIGIERRGARTTPAFLSRHEAPVTLLGLLRERRRAVQGENQNLTGASDPDNFADER